MSAPLRATVNGRVHEVAPGTRLLDFLAAQGVEASRVAVERNGEVVPRAEQAAILIRDGDAFEVVAFVGGG